VKAIVGSQQTSVGIADGTNKKDAFVNCYGKRDSVPKGDFCRDKSFGVNFPNGLVFGIGDVKDAVRVDC
jgi:hypothetical protein